MVLHGFCKVQNGSKGFKRFCMVLNGCLVLETPIETDFEVDPNMIYCFGFNFSNFNSFLEKNIGDYFLSVS